MILLKVWEPLEKGAKEYCSASMRARQYRLLCRGSMLNESLMEHCERMGAKLLAPLIKPVFYIETLWRLPEL